MPSSHPEAAPNKAAMASTESSRSNPFIDDIDAATRSEAAAGDSPATLSGPHPLPKESSTATMGLVLLSISLSMFPVGLDRTIVSTAIPVISNEFNSLDDVGWYGSAYLLTCCAFQLLFGTVYTLFPVKPVLLANILLFEVASVICGAAPNSTAFILGRAIAGVGAAGIFAGTIVCVVSVVPLHQRPKVQGMFGALFGLASILGPIIGGAFTSRVTWRWCFYINLPLGGAAMVIIAWLLKVPTSDTAKGPLGPRLARLDFIGTAILVPGVVCLLLALQWGGTAYTWSNGRIIALLTLAGVLLVSYGFVQAFSKTATLPPSLVKQRSVISALWATLTINASYYIFLYFLPIWFQAIQGVSPVDSGIRLLPVLVSSIFGAISSGWINARIGYYTPLAISGSCIMAIGAGLLTTFQVDTSAGKWIGYQILYGYGLGSCFQIPNLAVQAALPKPQVPVGLALMLFGSLIGSTIIVSVGQNVYSNQLIRRLSGFPGFNAQLVSSGGITAIIESIAPDYRPAALVAYNDALREVFRVGLIVACLAVLGTFTLEWLSVKKPQPGEPPAATSASPAGEEKTKDTGV